MLTNIPVVRFHPLISCQVAYQCIPKYRQIVEFPRCVWSIQPNNTPLQDTERQFIPQARPTKLMGVKLLPQLLHHEVSPIHRTKTVLLAKGKLYFPPPLHTPTHCTTVATPPVRTPYSYVPDRCEMIGCADTYVRHTRTQSLLVDTTKNRHSPQKTKKMAKIAVFSFYSSAIFLNTIEIVEI